jgi:hypothetical protein
VKGQRGICLLKTMLEDLMSLTKIDFNSTPPPRPASRYGRAALQLDLTLLRSALVLHNELLECGKLLCHDRLRRLIDKFRGGTKFCVG